ncbi:50S ribosomal protein L4 [Mesomycoplasma conjunctivae]|uniref:50S ribosomal protein L4 n=1 Tax=Mesomycoplasma conjunctivae TaxID=45361 RepID=UPI003DA3AAAD
MTQTNKVDNEVVKIEYCPISNHTKFELSTPLNQEIFGLEVPHSQAIFDTILYERASRRRATHKVKSRAEVSGTGKKPWKQKGTGKARAGSRRSPIFVGGGRAFGPTNNKNYAIKVNKKVRRLAFVSALSQLAHEKQILVDDFAMDKISTKELVKKLASYQLAKARFVLIASSDENLFISARNLQNVVVTKPSSLLVEQLIGADVLIISQKEINEIEGRFK